MLLADYNLSSVLPLTFLKKEREIFFLLLSLPVPQPHMPILKWKDMGRLRERKRTLRKRNPQGPKNPVSILLFLMLSAKIIICQQQKCGLQEHVLFSRKLFNTFANFNLSSSFSFFFPNQKHSLSKNHHSIAPTPNHLTEKRKKEEETSSFPLFSPISPIQYSPFSLPLCHIRATIAPLYRPHKPTSPIPTIPINSDSPTHTTNQKPFPLNSFGVISLY